MANQNISERRRFPRLNSLNLVSYKVYPAEEAVAASEGVARTLDMSAGGVMIQINESVDAQAILDLMIAIGDDIIQAKGLVVHVDQIKSDVYDLGIQFIDIYPDQLELLMRYIEKRDPNSSG
ncbi:MAG: PilZ domain-containing protein [Gemmatimonadetes bacterium]|nr:MAG: PilZ domain-containing protein [Gemmatimonadota bacterium]